MSRSDPAVLHISNADNLGGSARSAYKIHCGVRELGLKSRMLVKTKVTEDPDVDYLRAGRSGLRILDAVGRRVVDALGFQYAYYPSSFALAGHPWFLGSDVVQLYNTHGGFFSHRALPELSRRRPVVWRLSDMWPFTGHCAYSHDCERWKTGCGACPYLGEYPGLKWDRTAFLWKLKARVYGRSNLTVVVTNSWMEGLVRESPLLGRFSLHRIPNGIDTEVFRPIPRASAREALGLSGASRVVLFIAQIAKAGTRKGGDFVVPAMGRVCESGVEDLTLMVVGEGAESWPNHPGYRTIRMGYTQSDRMLAVAYSAADVLIHPAVVENLPNSILEGMACATPAVAFDAGGVGDAVRHMETGYLAQNGDWEDLARGIGLLLDHEALRSRMAVRSREVAVREYSQDLQVQRFAELYRELAAKRSAG